jgi:ubiquitin-protein ligase
MSLMVIAGPEEDLPRDMSYFEFVCHAPVDYFCQRSSYRCHVVNPPALNCVWTPFGPDIQHTTSICAKAANSADLLELNQKTAATSNSILEAQIIAVNETERRSDRDTSRRASIAKDRQPSNKAVLNRLKDKIAR